MSRILHLVNMVQRYHKSKGVREYRLEEPPLGSLAAPSHLEESASHHKHGDHTGSFLCTSAVLFETLIKF